MNGVSKNTFIKFIQHTLQKQWNDVVYALLWYTKATWKTLNLYVLIIFIVVCYDVTSIDIKTHSFITFASCYGCCYSCYYYHCYHYCCYCGWFSVILSYHYCCYCGWFSVILRLLSNPSISHILSLDCWIPNSSLILHWWWG